MKILDANEANCKDLAIILLLNGKDVTSRTWRARMPEKHGVWGIGWVDMYDLREDGVIMFDGDANGPTSRRRYGFIKTLPKLVLNFDALQLS